MREWWQRGLTRQLERLRSGGRATLLWSARITIAAVASYVVATLLFPGTQPLLAPLTAMLVVQVTPVSLLASGVDRVVAVVAGVSLAVGFAEVVPLQWWSLGVLILVALVIGEALRLRANLIEVAISGMLVLGVGSFDAQSAAWQRLAETLVGAAVGVLANLLFPPKPASASASRAIEGLAGSISDLLARAADELAALADDGRDLTAAARSWLGEARRITHDIPPVGAALLHAEQGRRLNVRAVGTPDTGPGLRQGLEALEHSAVAVRGLFSSLVEATYDAEWPTDESGDDVLLGLAQTFREMAQAVATFGRLVRGEADPAERAGPGEVYAVREALEGLHEARARLDELVTADTGPQLLRLHAAVLSTVQRLLREMDIDERVRRQVRLGRAAGLRRPRPVPRAGHDRPSHPEPTPEAETQVLPAVPPSRRDRRRP